MAAFPDTRWTLLLAGRASPEARARALDELARSYWRPLYARARRKGLDRDAAEDAVQSVLARLIEQDVVDRADPDRGRFRSYLCTTFDHWLASEYQRAGALKRGGAVTTVRIDTEAAERDLAGAPTDPDAIFLREWALAVMERALAALEEEFASGLRRGSFDAVRAFVGFEAEAPSYEEAASAHGLSVPALKSLIHRTRLRFRELVRAEVADTVATPEEVDAELRALVEALRP